MKPIAFFDTETTGTAIGTDKIVEIAIIKISGDQEDRLHLLINPEMPIPQGAIDVHGITDEMVKDKPTFKEVAPKITEFIRDCDFGGYNSNFFDIPLLYNQLSVVGEDVSYFTSARFVDVGVIFKRKEERTLSAAVQYYLNREHEGAHGALSDTEATIEVFKAMRERYEDLRDLKMPELDSYCNYDKKRADISGKFSIDDDGDYVFTFGKNKGVKARKEPGMLQWMLDRDFMPDTKEICKSILSSL